MNPYQVLGVAESASQDEIKAAFRSIAFQYHPDRNPNNPQAEAKFKEANAAYELIGTPEKRDEFEQQKNAAHIPDFNFESMFADFFGGIPNFGSRRQSNVFRNNVKLTLAQTLEPFEQIISIPARKPCVNCKGTGAGKKPVRCTKCNGGGCRVCGGAGMIYHICEACDGNGYSETPTEIKINIPKGIFANTQLQTKTKFGTVLTAVEIDFPEGIKLGAGGKLVMDVYIPYHVAVLGGIHSINIYDGSTLNVKFPALQNNNQLIKLKGKGLYPGPNMEERGDLFLAPKIAIPTNISNEYKTILEQLATLYTKEEGKTNNESTI